MLYDRNQPGARQGLNVPLAETYCALVGQRQAPVNSLDDALDPQAQGMDTTVIPYCGGLIRDAQGQPYGTLCHYDRQRCQERSTDLPLPAAAHQLYQRQHPGIASVPTK